MTDNQTVTRQQVIDAVFAAVDAVNAQRRDKPPLAKDLSTVLYGSGSDVDSLGLIELVVAVEEQVEQLGLAVTLVDERALSQEVSPFSTMGTLVDYVVQLGEEQRG
jgi:acyl carrier protein